MNIKDIISVANNPYANVAEDAICGEIKGWVDSGSYALNALLSGSIFKGFPSNKIVGFIGVESTGKCARGSQSIEVYFKSLEDLEEFLSV